MLWVYWVQFQIHSEQQQSLREEMDGVEKHLNLIIAIIELKFVNHFFNRCKQRAMPSKTSLSGIRLHFGQKVTNRKLETVSGL